MPVEIQLLFDDAVCGESKYGIYNLYGVFVKGEGEFSYFAPQNVHEKLRHLKKGDRAILTKKAKMDGRKVLTTIEVKIPEQIVKKSEIVAIADVIPEIIESHENLTKHEAIEEPRAAVSHDRYYEVLKQSYSEALEINKELNGATSDIARLCITLFIARSKTI